MFVHVALSNRGQSETFAANVSVCVVVCANDRVSVWHPLKRKHDTKEQYLCTRFKNLMLIHRKSISGEAALIRNVERCHAESNSGQNKSFDVGVQMNSLCIQTKYEIRHLLYLSHSEEISVLQQHSGYCFQKCTTCTTFKDVQIV